MRDNPWFIHFWPAGHPSDPVQAGAGSDTLKRPQIRLYCFPYAGAGAAVFQTFAAGLPEEIEVWAANLPGHGSRLHEEPLVDLPFLVGMLAQAIAQLQAGGRGQVAGRRDRDRGPAQFGIRNSQFGIEQPATCNLQPATTRTTKSTIQNPQSLPPFAFFGHSLGALLAFEVGRLLRRQGRALPVHLFVAACPAPQLLARDRSWHRLADDELAAELRRYNGLPDELLAEPELLALFLPALRADLTLYETAVYQADRPFAFPITAFGGDHDPLVNAEELRAWRGQTSGPFHLTLFDGDHFFLRAAQPAVLAGIASAEWQSGKWQVAGGR
jgi:medium-chain acyl-[acyl-carrier-protein] hydrolase